MNIFLSDLQEKDVVSIKTGLNHGHIVDVEINEEGKVVKFIAENPKILKKLGLSSEIAFNYSNIEKIGKDVIIINN